MENLDLIKRAAEIISGSQALLITAGAGMGVDSGLPDFRGPEGFWKAYPAYRRLGVNFADMADPRHFRHDPALAWGFYGHRMQLYRDTPPHAGFGILKRWAKRIPGGCGVFTSNVDGQFQRAGFDDSCVTEVHGSIHHLQCFQDCGIGIFPADAISVDIDEETMRCRSEWPRCPSCGGLARPNILMFGDSGWDDSRTSAQEERLSAWREANDGLALAIVELGAGTGIPTVRYFSESVVHADGGRLIRINVRESHVPAGQIGLAMGALEGLQRIDEQLAR